MPAPTTMQALLDLIRRSRLVEPARFEGYLAVHGESATTPEAFCRKMQADGLLTSFHVEQLLRGKHRGYFLGKYKILDRIGLGGMGQVFLAEHASMKRRVAIKVLPPDRAENEFTRERFMREARASGQLDHPNLVRAFDVDSEGDVYFLVMEYIDGISFHDLVGRFGPLTPARAAYYLWQAACGLEYLSSRGLIHRDIKPANLLVDRLGVVKILDLGLVRSEVENDDLTRGEGVKILGTADYLAPEQAIDCSKVDIRADLYSLGATGYYLLTGRPPFEGEKVAHKLIAHQTKSITPVHVIRPEVPPELSAVISTLLAKKPGERFQTPNEVMDALASWAQNPPPAPTEHEIPVTSIGSLGSPHSAVSIISPHGRVGHAGSSSSLSMQSGSSLRYQTPLHPPGTVTPRPGSMPGPIDKPAPIAEAPPITLTPPPKRSGSLPPLLPAMATHGVTTPPPPQMPLLPGMRPVSMPAPAPTASQAPLPAPRPTVDTSIPTTWTAPALPAVAPARSIRHRLSMAVAFSLTVAVAAWDVAVLTGVMARIAPPAKVEASAAPR